MLSGDALFMEQATATPVCLRMKHKYQNGAVARVLILAKAVGLCETKLRCGGLRNPSDDPAIFRQLHSKLAGCIVSAGPPLAGGGRGRFWF